MVAQLVSGRAFAKVHFATKQLPRDVHTTQVVKEVRTVTVPATSNLKTESSLADFNSTSRNTGKVVGHKVETAFYKAANECPEQLIVRQVPIMEYPEVNNSNPVMGEFVESPTNWDGFTSNTLTHVRRILEDISDNTERRKAESKEETIRLARKLGAIAAEVLSSKEQELVELQEDFDDFIEDDIEEYGSIADPVFLYN